MRLWTIVRVVGIAGLVVVGLLAIYRYGNGRTPQGEDPSLSSRLEMELDSGASVVDFAELFPGNWEYMHVFAPFTTERQVTEALGKPWPHFDLSGIDETDVYCLVVFERDGDVYGWYRQPNVVNLEALSAKGPFPQKSARFKAARSGGESKWSLRVMSP